jgi:hypothetical protein
MKPLVILTLMEVLFFTAFVPACTAPPAPDPSPQGILKSYIQNVNDRDTQAVHEALSSGLRSGYDRAYETTRQDPVHDALYSLERQGATIQTVTIVNQTITGQNASVEVDYFWHYPGISRIDERRQIVELVNEGGVWKLNSFFPFEGQDILSGTTPPRSATPLPTANVTTTRERDPHSCPAFLVNPPEFTCPWEMQPRPETYTIADPDHPTQKEIDAIPVDFPGVDRMTLIRAALGDPCVKEFLKSGGVIEGITDQPRSSRSQSDTVRWPPTLMADRWINCTDLRVFFDIDPSAGKVTRIWGETL